jgi:hypothetical protein
MNQGSSSKARSRPGRGREQVIRRRKVRRIAKAGQGQRPGQDDEVQVKIRMADERGIVIEGKVVIVGLGISLRFKVEQGSGSRSASEVGCSSEVGLCVRMGLRFRVWV